jgi:uncharacterized protein (DUF885 family)
MFERFPAYGSEVGRHEFDGELEQPSEKLYAAHEKLLRSTLAAIENLPETDFGGNDWIDRRALLAELRTDLWSLERGTHRSNPDRYVSGAMNSVFELIVKRADDFTPVAAAVVSRLKKIPAYLDGASSLLKNPVPRWQQMAQQSAEGAPPLFQAIRDGLVKCGKVAPAKAQALCDAAAQAVAAFAKRTAKLKPGAPDSFSLGRERFEALIRERLGWDLTAAEAGALGRTLAERLEAEMRAEARRLGGKDPRALLERAAADWKPQHADLFDEYTHQTARVAEAYRDARLVSFPPGEKLLLKRVPEFLRHHFPTAAYSSPGCFDADQTGIFWVNDMSVTKTAEKEKRAEVAQHFGLAMTCAHEAYPGHHLQFCTANRHPSPLRRLFSHAIFYEGWTLWCEQMCVDQGIVTDRTARLSQLHDALWRAHRIQIDVGLQTGEMSYDDAVKHLMKHVGFTRTRAEGDVNWYTMSPTVPMSYLLGKMEVLRVKRKKVEQQGWTLQRFNDWALSFGTVPWRWMELSGL